jgi:hypothetical protein
MWRYPPLSLACCSLGVVDLLLSASASWYCLKYGIHGHWGNIEGNAICSWSVPEAPLSRFFGNGNRRFSKWADDDTISPLSGGSQSRRGRQQQATIGWKVCFVFFSNTCFNLRLCELLTCGKPEHLAPSMYVSRTALVIAATRMNCLPFLRSRLFNRERQWWR